MKRLSADDSADSRVKVGHRQATYKEQKPLRQQGLFVSLEVTGLRRWAISLLML